MSRNRLHRVGAAICELVARARLSQHRPESGIKTVDIGGRLAAVRETAVHQAPFCTLLHLEKDVATAQPRVLLVAPMSGHFATLLRGTAQTLLADHDVYITDWHNARDIGLRHGEFGFDEFIDHVITFLQVAWPRRACRWCASPTLRCSPRSRSWPKIPDPAQPRSMTLMAGPIDARVNSTEVNRLATNRPIEWFERNLIGIVPLRYARALRRVYPGFVQLAAFMSMNLHRHVKAQIDLFCHLANGEDEKAAAIRAFYDEYCAVMELPAEFYLQTVRTVFQEHSLPLGKFEWRGRRIDPSAIRRTALFTVEGERDDICGVGQTLAEQELCQLYQHFAVGAAVTPVSRQTKNERRPPYIAQASLRRQ